MVLHEGKGVGKSTLLDSLMGRVAVKSGSITLDRASSRRSAG